jgi:hypothetical protein
VVSVSSTTSESLMDTCERIMADPNLPPGDRRGPATLGRGGVTLGGAAG